MYTNNRIGLIVLLGVALTQLTACTPPAKDKLVWNVANSTDDSLRVSMRFSMDSTLLATPDQLTWARQRWQGDSSVNEGQGYYATPLQRLVRHQHQWYYVFSRVPLIRGLQYNEATRSVSYAKANLGQGLITYILPPHSIQEIMETGYDGGLFNELPPYIVDLWLEQGTSRRTIRPGRTMNEVFRPEWTGREYGNNSLHCVQLTVGPDLAINNWWRWWYGGKTAV